MDLRSNESGRVWVSVDALSGCIEAANNAGFDITPYLERHGIDPKLIDSAQGLIAFSSMSDCLEDIARSEQCPDFGFRLGITQKPLQFGLLSQILQAAPTVGAAIQIFLKYRDIYSQSSHWEMHTADGIAYLRRYDIHAKATKGPQILVYSMTRGFEAIKSLVGPEWAPFGIYFSCDSLVVTSAQRRHFGAPIFFNSQFDELAFPESDLERRLPNGNPELLAALIGYFDRLSPNSGNRGAVAFQVQKIFRERLGNGDCSLESIAASLAIHPRTLQRLLASEGTSYRKLEQETRMALAEQMVETTRMPFAEVAMLTGYQHLSSFSRAFKKNRNITASKQRHAPIDGY